MRIAFVGTDLAPLREESGALERVVLAWAEGLGSRGHETACFDASPDGPPLSRLGAFGPDLVVLNNRPGWSELVEPQVAVLQVLHNYEDAWSAGGAGGGYERALARPCSAVVAVSQALARHVESTFRTPVAVGVAAVAVEECFFEARWHGKGGPVLFPNRILEKKGVRFFLELAARLAPDGYDCRLFSHTAPFAPPLGEQRELLALAACSPQVELAEPPPGRAEMAAAYAGAGVVVCPSCRPEGLGLVALEAQAVGAPLVTSGLGGLAEVTLAPNEVVTCFDLSLWAEAIDRACRRAGSGAPSRLVADRHRPEAAAASLEREALRLLSAQRGRSTGQRQRV